MKFDWPTKLEIKIQEEEYFVQITIKVLVLL